MHYMLISIGRADMFLCLPFLRVSSSLKRIQSTERIIDAKLGRMWPQFSFLIQSGPESRTWTFRCEIDIYGWLMTFPFSYLSSFIYFTAELSRRVVSFEIVIQCMELLISWSLLAYSIYSLLQPYVTHEVLHCKFVTWSQKKKKKTPRFYIFFPSCPWCFLYSMQ